VLVLLDENVPHRLRALIADHDVRTVAFQKWTSLTNGDLVRAAEKAGFDVMLTADRSMRYQQNLALRRLAIIVLSTNEAVVVAANVPKIVDAIAAAKPGNFLELDLSEDLDD